MSTITAEELRERLHYDPETGLFTRRFAVRGHRVGSLAGSPNNKDYIVIRVHSKSYAAHRLAFLYMTGEFPSGQVDHINGIRQDNAFSNLRDVTGKVNAQNVRKATARNKTSGLLGVHRVYHYKKPFRATIRVNKKVIDLGLFDTAEEGHAAYVEAKRKYHEGCTL